MEHYIDGVIPAPGLFAKPQSIGATAADEMFVPQSFRDAQAIREYNKDDIARAKNMDNPFINKLNVSGDNPLFSEAPADVLSQLAAIKAKPEENISGNYSGRVVDNRVRYSIPDETALKNARVAMSGESEIPSIEALLDDETPAKPEAPASGNTTSDDKNVPTQVQKIGAKRARLTAPHMGQTGDKYLDIGSRFGNLASDTITGMYNKGVDEHNNEIDANRDERLMKIREDESAYRKGIADLQKAQLQALDKELHPVLETPSFWGDLDFLSGELPESVNNQLSQLKDRMNARANAQYNISTAVGQKEYNQAKADQEKDNQTALMLLNLKGASLDNPSFDRNQFNESGERAWYGARLGSKDDLWDKMLANTIRGKDAEKGTGLFSSYSRDKGTHALGNILNENRSQLFGYRPSQDSSLKYANALQNEALAAYDAGNLEKAKRALSMYQKALGQNSTRVFKMADPNRPKEDIWFAFTRDGKLVNLSNSGADRAATMYAPTAVEEGGKLVFPQQ